MTHVLIASDSAKVSAEVESAVSSQRYDVSVIDNGNAVLAAVKAAKPDLVVLDFQIGNKGGMANCLDIRLEESAGRLDPTPVLLLLDRRPDVFLARRAQANGWLLKPLDPIRLRKAVQSLLGGATYEDSSFLPRPVAVRESGTPIAG